MAKAPLCVAAWQWPYFFYLVAILKPQDSLECASEPHLAEGPCHTASALLHTSKNAGAAAAVITLYLLSLSLLLLLLLDAHPCLHIFRLHLDHTRVDCSSGLYLC